MARLSNLFQMLCEFACRGRSAKELSVQILEKGHTRQLCTHLEHANYLGREFQKAEFALLLAQKYVQD
jgi:dihydropteroate synthase